MHINCTCSTPAVHAKRERGGLVKESLITPTWNNSSRARLMLQKGL